jgi:ribosomal protein L29
MTKTKLLNIRELRKKTTGQLIKVLNEQQVEVNKSQITLKSDKQKDKNILKQNKKNIARIKTVLKEKRLMQVTGNEQVNKK